VSRASIGLTPDLSDYLRGVAVRDSGLRQRLRNETAKMPGAGMQISPEQGELMALLVRLMGARRCLEIGVFTGYSALVVAEALPADGRLVACDVNGETTTIAKRYWHEAGVAHKIDLRIAPALETLNGLIDKGQAGRFDFAFIDADKPNYDAYYERVLTLLRPGGLVAIDNVLWGGAVADPTKDDDSTKALRALNRKIHADARVTCAMLPVGDGLTLARKQG
jgi:predicted O-methyltransferase YrrM